jgi:hypothetical protein
MEQIDISGFCVHWKAINLSRPQELGAFNGEERSEAAASE